MRAFWKQVARLFFHIRRFELSASKRVVPKPPWKGRELWIEVAGGLVILGMVVSLLQISWLKWADPQVDFGRELYLPWAINQGDVLYRDIDANYGPLSHHWNALVFQLLGTGFRQLVWANLTLYALILVLVWWVARVAWGPVAAFAGTAGFVLFFSFNHIVQIGNYNFVAPYAHETTHGFLLVVALLAVLAGWFRRPGAWGAGAAGLLCGLTLLTKVEIILVAALVVVAALVLTLYRCGGTARVKPGSLRVQSLAFLVGGFLPPLTATMLFLKTGKFDGIVDAFLWANVGWSGIFIYPDITKDPIQGQFFGTAGWRDMMPWVVGSGLVVLAYCGSCAAILKRLPEQRKWALGLLVLGFCWVVFEASRRVEWIQSGRVLPVLLVATLITLVIDWRRLGRPANAGACVRWLLLVAAAAFMVRMALNPRIYHYGFCQGALAGVVACAFLATVLPAVFGLRALRLAVYRVVVALLIGAAAWGVMSASAKVYALKTQPVGYGDDTLYGFSAQVEPTHKLIEEGRAALAQAGDLDRLLVVPEGILVNYLLRKRAATRIYMFNPYWLRWREDTLKQLEKLPPDYVFVISRDMREYGIQRFGESEAHGSWLVDWINENTILLDRVGGDPLDPNQRGAMIFQVK